MGYGKIQPTGPEYIQNSGSTEKWNRNRVGSQTYPSIPVWTEKAGPVQVHFLDLFGFYGYTQVHFTYEAGYFIPVY